MKLKVSKNRVDYEDAVSYMERRVTDIHDGLEDECVWLLEHPPIYTAGTSAKEEDVLGVDFPVYQTGRGGEHTYHGPGQRVAYVMLNLKKRYKTPDIKHFIWSLEQWIILTLARFDIKGERREGRVGIWVVMPDGSETKIAAIGIRIRRWVSYHGISINVNPDLSHFEGIVPCGIKEHGVTSMHALGKDIGYEELDEALQATFPLAFKSQK